MRRLVQGVAAVVGALLFAGALRAHWTNLSILVLALDPQGSRITLTVPGDLVPEGDANGDGHVRPEEVMARADRVATALAGKLALQVPGRAPVPFKVEGGGPPRVDTRVDTGAPDESHVEIRLAFAAAPTEGLRLRYELLAEGDPEASCKATIHRIGVPSISHVFTPAQREIRVGGPLREGMARRGAEDALGCVAPALFPAALAAAGPRVGAYAMAGVAYVAMHAVVLVLATHGIVVLDPGLLAVLVALTLVFAAAENFWRADGNGRAKLAGAFGAVHGAALGMALARAMPTDERAAALPGYLVGASAAQVGLLVATFLVLGRLGGAPRRAVSAVLVAVGLISALLPG